MIDLALLRKNPDLFAQAWANRGVDVSVPELVALDQQVRQLKQEAEDLQAQANAASKAIGQAARQGKDINEAKTKARRLGDEAKVCSDSRIPLEEQLTNTLLGLPNPCLDEVPVGTDEADNEVLATWGDLPSFAFAPQAHWDLAPALDIIDFERGARLGGSGFVVYKGVGARLVRALITFFLDQLTGEHGYTELMVPHLVQPAIMQGTGQLPKFQEDLYYLERDDRYLIPTAEVPVTNYLGGEILDGKELPKKFCAYTPCFRREAGAAGVGTRGIQRTHQFDKVEMVWLAHPETSRQDLDTLRGHAETLLQKLGLHYRVLQLCTGDTGFSAACTHDLEVWSPGTGAWLEVSSCSVFTDFQSRRAKLRFKEGGSKPQLVHTLNGSGLAIPRCLIAILETYQQADGSVLVPEVLHPYLGGLKYIK